MPAPDTVTEPPQPERRPPPPDPAAATASVPDPSTPGPRRADRPTSSITTGDVPIAPGADPSLPSIPGYHLLGVLGRGGMGTVYHAVHLEMHREVALKLINPGGRDEESVRGRFTREVRALAKIEHPHIVTIYDSGEWQGFPFYTMKLLPRGPLSGHLDRLVGDVRAGVRLVAKVARAVGVLHAARVLHRDLKPLNILLGEGDEPLVADFGLARWIGDDSGPTESGAPVGTRPYMSPEQSLGSKGDYTEACDIWALGVILFEVLTGRRPFAAEDTVELYLQIRNEPPPPASSVNPTVPPELDGVIARCLRKRPEDRYPTADAVADDLERWLAGEPLPKSVTADAPPPARQRRRRRLVAAALAALLGGVSAGVAYWPRTDHTGGSAPTADPPRKWSIAERLAAGETVELVGPSGLPLVEARPIPTADVALSTVRDGCCTLASIGVGAVELSHEPLPRPVRLEADVALLSNHHARSRGGLYVARREAPGANGVHQAMAVFFHSDAHAQGADGPEIREIASAQTLWWNPLPSVTVRLGAEHQAITPGRPTTPESLRWHRWQIVIDPGRLAATWDNHTLPAISAAEFDKKLQLVPPRSPTRPAFPPPTFGPGVGLYVENADAVFRNTRLVPLVP